MIKDSTDKAVEKYGLVKVKFKNYYKYTFYYSGTVGGLEILVCVGGNYSDIYRFEVDADNFECIVTLNPYRVEVRDNSGNLIEEYND